MLNSVKAQLVAIPKFQPVMYGTKCQGDHVLITVAYGGQEFPVVDYREEVLCLVRDIESQISSLHTENKALVISTEADAEYDYYLGACMQGLELELSELLQNIYAKQQATICLMTNGEIHIR